MKSAVTKTSYTYYMPFRPPSPGCQPMEGLLSIIVYDERMKVGLNLKAWGAVTYDRPLTDQEIKDYELVPMDEE